MELTLEQLSRHLGARLHGDPARRVVRLAPLPRARCDELSFLSDRSFRQYLKSTQAAAVILSPRYLADCSVDALVMDDPYLGYAKAARLLTAEPKVVAGVHPTALIAISAQLDDSVQVGAYTVVEENAVIEAEVVLGPGCRVGRGVRVGARSRLVSAVSLLDRVQLGCDTILHPGVVIGADGFGFAYVGSEWLKIPQLGTVVIGDGVEIGANSTIDRGALDNTVIGDGVKIDNQVQIGHNVCIGAHTAIAGCVGVAGSTRIGEHCQIGGACMINGHIELADRVIVNGGSTVAYSLSKPGKYSSTVHVMEIQTWKRNLIRFMRLERFSRERKFFQAASGAGEAHSAPLDPPPKAGNV